ncbi:MAG: Ig-like domain-containing protein [Bacteroidales bacterium]
MLYLCTMIFVKYILSLALCFAAAVPALAEETINIAAPFAAGGTGWSFADSVVTISANGNYTVTGSTTSNRIVVNKNVTATVTLNNVNIHSATASPFALSSDNTTGSDVTLILSGSNELVTTDFVSAGLTVEDSAKITIQGTGSLLAQGGDLAPKNGGGAGIGGRETKSGGNITITGGTITATGGFLAAAIGGGAGGDGGNITITGGTVTATAGAQAAGIGGGKGDSGGSGGNITITGGTITATGGTMGAGIGGGYRGDGGNITITGGTITATGGTYAAGIGGGWESDGGNIITIRGGVVVAVSLGGSGDPAGIGGGGTSSAGTVNISGGTVYASGGTGPGIGGGAGTTGGVINITGGTVITDEIGIGGAGGTTQTNISGANTLVLSQTINTATFGGAQVLTGNSVNVSSAITIGDAVADVTLNADLTIPSGATLTIPAGITFNVNHKVLTHYGTLINHGSLINDENLIDNTPPAPTDTIPEVIIGQDWMQDLLAQTYTGDSIKPAVTVRDGTKKLTLDRDYTVVYTDNVKAGTARVTVTGMGNYGGTIVKSFTIAPKALTARFIQDISPQTYTGDSITPAVTVKNGSVILTPDTDYTVAYTDNINVGTATATVTGMGNYTGSTSKTFIIEAPPDTIPTDTIPDNPLPPDTVPADTVPTYPVDTVPVSGVSFYNDNYIMAQGKALQLFAIVVPADADNRNVKWSTSNPAVATVSDNGQVKAVSAGEATITVTTDEGNKTATCRIRVLDGVITTDVVKENVIYHIIDKDSVVYHIVAKDSTVYNLIIRDSTAYNIITKDSVEYDIIVRDSVNYHLTARDSVVYNMITKDSIDYNLVPERIYIATDITGAEHIVTDDARVVRVGTTLRLEGLTPGKTFSIYTVTGGKYYSGTAQSDVFRLNNPPAGVYILYHDGQYSKFSY